MLLIPLDALDSLGLCLAPGPLPGPWAVAWHLGFVRNSSSGAAPWPIAVLLTLRLLCGPVACLRSGFCVGPRRPQASPEGPRGSQTQKNTDSSKFE